MTHRKLNLPWQAITAVLAVMVLIFAFTPIQKTVAAGCTGVNLADTCATINKDKDIEFATGNMTEAAIIKSPNNAEPIGIILDDNRIGVQYNNGQFGSETFTDAAFGTTLTLTPQMVLRAAHTTNPQQMCGILIEQNKNDGPEVSFSIDTVLLGINGETGTYCPDYLQVTADDVKNAVATLTFPAVQSDPNAIAETFVSDYTVTIDEGVAILHKGEGALKLIGDKGDALAYLLGDDSVTVQYSFNSATWQLENVTGKSTLTTNAIARTTQIDNQDFCGIHLRAEQNDGGWFLSAAAQWYTVSKEGATDPCTNYTPVAADFDSVALLMILDTASYKFYNITACSGDSCALDTGYVYRVTLDDSRIELHYDVANSLWRVYDVNNKGIVSKNYVNTLAQGVEAEGMRDAGFSFQFVSGLARIRHL